MGKLLVFVCIFVWGMGLSFARVNMNPCAIGYSQDSAGLGIEAGVTGQDITVRCMNSSCYNTGKVEGAALKADDICVQQFMSGKKEGLKASGFGAGTVCYAKGYIAGTAWLSVGAREGLTSVVDAICIDAYQKGLATGLSSGQYNPPKENPYLSCYDTGYYDAASLKCEG